MEVGTLNNCFKSPQGIVTKIKSGAHQEQNTEEYTNLDNIKNKLEKNEDLFDRNFTYKKIELDETFPEYILENKSKFKSWII